MNPVLTKSYTAGAALAGARIVKFGSADYAVIAAIDGTAPVAGVTVPNINVAAGETVDVVKVGLARLKLGGVVTRGQWIVAGAAGVGVAASIVPGVELHVIGKAEESGVLDDEINIFVQPIVIATDVGILTADVTITTAQLLALNAAEQPLVATPGAGKALVLESAQLHKPAGTAYGAIAAGEDLAIKYTDDAGAVLATIETTGFLDQSSAQSRYVHPTDGVAAPLVANAPLVLHLLAGEITTGDSDLHVRVRYRVIDVDLTPA